MIAYKCSGAACLLLGPLQRKLALAAGLLALLLASQGWGGDAAAAAKFTRLYAFRGFANGDGQFPTARLLLDAKGRLFGVTTGGGVSNTFCNSGCGTVFVLTPKGNGWIERLAYAFEGGDDGNFPAAALIVGPGGGLYGTTEGGGSPCGGFGCGTAYVLTPSGQNWTETVIHSFSNGDDGANPEAKLVLFGGNLYGTLQQVPSSCNCGAVFVLSPIGGGNWSEFVIYSFAGQPDGANPAGGLLTLGSNFYGATFDGGSFNNGAAYMLTPSIEKTVKRGAASPAGAPQTTESVIWSFGSSFQAPIEPVGGLVSDSQGNLYGATGAGGGPGCFSDGCGAVFKLTPPPAPGARPAAPARAKWKLTILYKFAGGPSDGAGPIGDLLLRRGKLYGVTNVDGGVGCLSRGCGIVFELSPQTGKTIWKETILYEFTGGTDGGQPNGGLIADKSGALYGVANGGGGVGGGSCNQGCGTVYKIVP